MADNKEIPSGEVMTNSTEEEPISNSQQCDPELGGAFLSGAEEGDQGKLEELLERDPNLIYFQDDDGYTALHRAAYSDRSELIKYLLAKGSCVTARTHDGWTPLHSASRWNAWASVRILLGAGADPNAKSDGGQTPLHVAADSGKHEAVTLLLLQPGVDPWILNSAGDSAHEIASRQGIYAYLFELARKSINRF